MKSSFYWKKEAFEGFWRNPAHELSLLRGSRTDRYKMLPGDRGKEKTSCLKVKYFTSKSGQLITTKQLVECSLGHL